MFRHNPDQPLRGMGGTGLRPWTKWRENQKKGAEEVETGRLDLLLEKVDIFKITIKSDL